MEYHSLCQKAKDLDDDACLTILKASDVMFNVFTVVAALCAVHAASQANVDLLPVDAVILVVNIFITVIVFIQLSLAYHIFFFRSVWSHGRPLRGLHLFSSYMMLALFFMAFAPLYPGLANTNEGILLDNHLFRLSQPALLCIAVSASRLSLGSAGVMVAILVSFINATYGPRLAFMFFYLGGSVYHHLLCLRTGVSAYIFVLLVPPIALPFLTGWTQMTEVGLCKGTLPLLVWLAGMTFPTVYLWFSGAGWLETSFCELFSDSAVLSVLHNKLSPSAIPFRILIPIEIVCTFLTVVLAAGTCSARSLLSDSDLPYLAGLLAVGNLTLYWIPYLAERSGWFGTQRTAVV